MQSSLKTLVTMKTLAREISIMSLLVMNSVVCWEMTLLHVNDIHVRMEETNTLSSNCKEEKKQAGECYGGLARLHAAVTNIKNNEDHVLWLNAGDFYQGTVWYTHFKWRVVSYFNNLLKFDAITLGNHEFDDAVAGVVPFLKNQSCPVVVSNMDDSQVPELQGLYKPSVVLDVGGKKVGIVGYITPETMEVSNPGKNLVINEELEAVTKEVDKLHREGVDIIVGLGHSGYEKDIELAMKVPNLDVVVGGHTHSFLFSETKEKSNPSTNTIRGPYPTIVNNVEGGKALVVQAYAYTKYLGHVKLNFSDQGALVGWTGEPILLDNRFKEDPAMVEELRPWKEKIESFGKEVVGSTKVLLAQSRERESNIGDFITDAMVWAYRDRTGMSGGKISLALINSGGVRASFEVGNITVEDLLTTMPFSNTFDLVTVKGLHLRKAFEHSVSKMGADGSNDDGGFLQVSGFRLKYDLREDIGHRLIAALVLVGGELKDLEDTLEYDVVTTDYMVGGGNGYKLRPIRKLQGLLDVDILKEYLHSKSPVHQVVEERIAFITRNKVAMVKATSIKQNQSANNIWMKDQATSTIKTHEQSSTNANIKDTLISSIKKQDLPSSNVGPINVQNMPVFTILNVLKYIYFP